LSDASSFQIGVVRGRLIASSGMLALVSHMALHLQPAVAAIQALGDGWRGLDGATIALHITGDATTSVKSGFGVLHSITFNNPTATETVTIYDNTAASGTKIGTIAVPSSPGPVTLTYDVVFDNGLTIFTATASSDITVALQ
jgi:hypothetical protein